VVVHSLETLALRMREHCANAAEVALHLQRHPEVLRVIRASERTGNRPGVRRST
jgi:O-acetylhomoserine/O-acetylserine sulfhydrylase-like pyridoxal-dependent enzyme